MADKKLFYITDDKKKMGDLSGRYSKKWVEESLYLDNFGISPPSSKRNHLGVSISKKIINLFLLIIFFGVSIILGRIFYLQVIKGSDYRILAEGNRIRMRPISAERGIIYDNHARQLVQNVPSFSLNIVPRDLPSDSDKREMVLQKVAAMVGMSYQQIIDLLRQYQSYSYESLVVKENLDHTTALRLYLQNTDLPGVAIESGTKRNYINTGFINSGILGVTSTALSFSHLLGYVGKLNINDLHLLQSDGYFSSDDIGKTGLEKQYEKSLRGQYGRQKIEVDAMGRAQNVLAEDPPIPGQNLYLTIDAEAQAVFETIISKRLGELGLKRAAGVALDPETGAVLALVSLPTFDNNDFSGGISKINYQKYLNDINKPLFNRVIGGSYPSGSTIKPVIAAAALEEKIITKNTAINSVGSIQVGKWTFRDWKIGGHGITNVTKAIAWSVNSFFYYIGGGYGNFVGLGAEKLIKYLLLFNLGQITGVDLPGEQDGFVPSPTWKEETKNEAWYVGDTYNLSIGQGELLVTPIQLAMWTSAFANGGKIIVPHLADYFQNAVNKQINKLNFPIKKKNLVSQSTMDVVRQGMRECVLTGSCQLLKTLPFTTAGKTGTAQWVNNKAPHAWFTSFAPYDNPRIVVSILVEEGTEGSTAAMPIARDFLKWWGAKYLK
ncbi:MAG: penicillin-binding protein 2 [Candidatus Magasanikbacteria bacterium]